MRNTDSASLNRQYNQLLWNIDAPLLSKGNGYNVYSKWNIDIFKGNILCSEFLFCRFVILIAILLEILQAGQGQISVINIADNKQEELI